MKANAWCATPHVPLRHPERYYDPYICRIAPADHSFELQWGDHGSDGAHTLYYRLRGSEDEWVAVPLTEKTVKVNGIENLVDYELYIEREDKSAKSLIRLVNACDAPGVVINYIHPEDDYYDFAGNFIGTPNIVKLPSGHYLATHDVFGKSEYGFSMVFLSKDKGATWEHQCDLHPICECKPFVHNGRLYLIGRFSLEEISISESLDEGKTWCEPSVILRGDYYFNVCNKSGFQLSETDIIVHNGRIFMSFEVGAWGQTSGDGFVNSMLSAPADADLFDINNWEYVPLTKVPQDIVIPGVKYDYLVAIEGNPISGPDGELYNMMRIDHILKENIARGDFSTPNNMALLYRFKSFDEPLEFVQTVDVAVGLRSMFFVKYDEVTGYYFVLGNECQAGNETEEPNGTRRCIYTLSASKDLKNWRKLKELINCSQYPNYCVSQPAFVFDGDDLCYMSRTGWGKIENQHNNNLLTFHVEKNFRNLL